MPKTDTGLHISMRLLLGIVAGLLISNILKVTVKTFETRVNNPAGLQDVLTVLATTLFLIRIVVDNVLYYSDPDARTTQPAYTLRVALIVVDLVTYGVCYYMVAILETAVSKATQFQDGTLRSIVMNMALVEFLQFICCVLAVELLPIDASKDADRAALLKKWATLSLTFAALSFVVGLLLLNTVAAPYAGVIILALSLFSAWTYMRVLRDQRYLGPATAWS